MTTESPDKKEAAVKISEADEAVKVAKAISKLPLGRLAQSALDEHLAPFIVTLVKKLVSSYDEA